MLVLPQLVRTSVAREPGESREHIGEKESIAISGYALLYLADRKVVKR